MVLDWLRGCRDSIGKGAAVQPGRAAARHGRSVKLTEVQPACSMVHGSVWFLYQNDEGIECKLTLGSSTSLVGRARLAEVAQFLEAFKTLHASFNASPAPKLDGRWWWMLLVLGVSFNPQKLTKIMSSGSAKVLSFDEPNPSRWGLLW
jgi:hypothetical protein